MKKTKNEMSKTQIERAATNEEEALACEIDKEAIDQYVEDWMRYMCNPPHDGPRRLPVVEYKGKLWFLDLRLKQIRNVYDPHEFFDLKKGEEIAFMAASIEQSYSCSVDRWKSL